MSSPLRVAAVIFPGFELLDLYGPLELLGMMGEAVTVTVAAEAAGPVSSSQAPKGFADAVLSAVDRADLLLVPGGVGTRREVGNEGLLESLRRLSASARWVASVCTGSALLARAGLLEGRRATSNKRAFDWVSAQSKGVDWIRQARWVEDGRFFTSSGVSAGMDMTLALIEREFGVEARRAVAARAEYTWHADSTIDPFSTPEPQGSGRLT